ncbi:MAG: Coenzyme F420 hydrogenase/dehydrogenase, beta subunit C-terminal domain [Prevotella sp.]|nr:Coenzyme F420 hydrogenase/dehydrogenase, beta subunit C-terminal domain [Candidatus Prevotella equi]
MWYTKTFYQHIMFRHSCGNCHFCNTKRPSDITIADFWGWQKQDPNINSDDKGLNLVLINTPKGKEIFDAIKNRLEVIDASPEAYMQPNLHHPSRIHKKRMKFEEDYVKKGFKYIYKRSYDERPYWKQIAAKIYVPLIKLIRK